MGAIHCQRPPCPARNFSFARARTCTVSRNSRKLSQNQTIEARTKHLEVRPERPTSGKARTKANRKHKTYEARLHAFRQLAHFLAAPLARIFHRARRLVTLLHDLSLLGLLCTNPVTNRSDFVSSGHTSPFPPCSHRAGLPCLSWPSPVGVALGEVNRGGAGVGGLPRSGRRGPGRGRRWAGVRPRAAHLS